MLQNRLEGDEVGVNIAQDEVSHSFLTLAPQRLPRSFPTSKGQKSRDTTLTQQSLHWSVPTPRRDFTPEHKYSVLREIEGLEPGRDHERIAFLSSTYDFPWDTQRALELALLRTFAVPKSSELMVYTREFTERTQKRYDDTVIIMSTIGFYGHSSPEGRRAIRRMNQIHGHYAIPNDEFLYVLSTFVFEPIRWNARFGWRPLSKKERLASFYFWREVGRLMAMRDIPETYEALERFNRDYEHYHFAYSPSNQKLAEATRDLFLSWVLPKPLQRFGRPFVYAVLDEPMRNAFGFPAPPRWVRWIVENGLRLRALALRFLPPRREPYRLPPTRTYPEGYELEELGSKEATV